MSVTIEDVMELVYKRLKARMYEWDVSEVLEADEAIKSAIGALVAQARDDALEEAAQVCDIQGTMRFGPEFATAIRARIAGRKDGGART